MVLHVAGDQFVEGCLTDYDPETGTAIVNHMVSEAGEPSGRIL